MKQLLVIKIMLLSLVACSFDYSNPNHRKNIDYSAPEIIAVSKGSDSFVELEWAAAQQDIERFTIYKGIEIDSLSKIASVNGGLTSYVDEDFAEKETNIYYYAVEAVFANREISECSDPERGYIFNTSFSFADTTLDRVVKEAVGVPINGLLYPSDVAGLTSLDARNKGIGDISGIENLKALTTLDLSVNEISSLAPLSSLTGLTSLTISRNKISDLGPLSKLKELTTLYCYINSVSDLKPLSGLTKLTTLSLWANRISDLTPLSALTGLETLDLNVNSISNVKPLKSLEKAVSISLSFNDISDVSSLGSLPELTTLYLHKNDIGDLDHFVNPEYFKKLNTVTVTENPLSVNAKTNQVSQVQTRGITISFDP